MTVSIKTSSVHKQLETICYTKSGETRPHYTQWVLRDNNGFTLSWHDTNGHREAFDVTQVGVNKRGEPIFEVNFMESDIVWYTKGVRYYTKKDYETALAQALDTTTGSNDG